MKAPFGISACAGLFILVLLVPALAGDITEGEKQFCRNDYHNYCSDYGLGTEALRACMSRNIKRISHACVGALVEAREMTQAQADKLRGSGKSTKKSRTSRRGKTSSHHKKRTRH